MSCLFPANALEHPFDVYDLDDHEEHVFSHPIYDHHGLLLSSSIPPSALTPFAPLQRPSPPRRGWSDSATTTFLDHRTIPKKIEDRLRKSAKQSDLRSQMSGVSNRFKVDVGGPSTGAPYSYGQGDGNGNDQPNFVIQSQAQPQDQTQTENSHSYGYNHTSLWDNTAANSFTISPEALHQHPIPTNSHQIFKLDYEPQSIHSQDPFTTHRTYATSSSTYMAGHSGNSVFGPAYTSFQPSPYSSHLMVHRMSHSRSVSSLEDLDIDPSLVSRPRAASYSVLSRVDENGDISEPDIDGEHEVDERASGESEIDSQDDDADSVELEYNPKIWHSEAADEESSEFSPTAPDTPLASIDWRKDNQKYFTLPLLDQNEIDIKPKVSSKKTFKTALWEVINNPIYLDYIHWAADGRSGVIPDKRKFQGSAAMREITEASTVDGFVRQLHMWGFSRYRIDNDCKLEACGFHHPYFQRGSVELLDHVTRRMESKLSRPWSSASLKARAKGQKTPARSRSSSATTPKTRMTLQLATLPPLRAGIRQSARIRGVRPDYVETADEADDVQTEDELEGKAQDKKMDAYANGETSSQYQNSIDSTTEDQRTEVARSPRNHAQLQAENKALKNAKDSLESENANLRQRLKNLSINVGGSTIPSVTDSTPESPIKRGPSFSPEPIEAARRVTMKVVKKGERNIVKKRSIKRVRV